MIKIFQVLSILLGMLFGFVKEEKTMTCTRSLNQNDMKMEFEYTVTYQKDTVNEVKSVETIEYDDLATLEVYQGSIEAIYSAYDNIEHYDYEVKIDGNLLTSTAIINYASIDTDKLIDIDSANGQLIKDGKVSIDDIESVYTATGASCTRD